MKTIGLWIVAGAMMASSAVAVGQSSQSSAQNALKYDLKNGREDFSNDYGSKVILKFMDNPTGAYTGAGGIARCLAGNAKDKADGLLGGPFTKDPGLDRLTKALSGKYRVCSPDADSGLPLFVINAALAEQLLRANPPALKDPVAPSDLPAAQAFYAESGGVTMDGLGRCLSVYSPTLAYAILGTEAGSAQEQQAMRALYSQTPECGVPAPPAGIPAVEQRSALVTGLYHWTHRG